MRYLATILFLLTVGVEFLLLPGNAKADSANLLTVNPDFTQMATGGNGNVLGWSLWARTPGAATGNIDTALPHGGKSSYRIDSTADTDWSFSYDSSTPVQPNVIYTTGAWVRCSDAAEARLDVIERAADGTVLNWSYAPAPISGTHDWIYLTHRFVPEPGTSSIQFRLEGSGKGAFWIAEPSLTSQPLLVNRTLSGKTLTLRNPQLLVTLNSQHGSLTVTDRKTKRVWTQVPSGGEIIVEDSRRIGPYGAQLKLLDAVDMLQLSATITLDPVRRKIEVSVSGDGMQSQPVAYPPAFLPQSADLLVVPNNEGLLYPAADKSVEPYDMPLYGGHAGLSMPWYAISSPQTSSGVVTIVETPDDATLRLVRRSGDGLLLEQPVWESAKHRFAYPRKLEYIFMPSGGYVEQAKVYRQYADARGLVRTLAQKRAANPNVDKLIGSVDVWSWDSNAAVQLCKEFRASGMEHVLWSSGESPEAVKQINALGYLTSSYDIYQDEYPPNAPEWLPKGDWPSDLIWGEDGKPIVSWIDHETTSDGKPVSYTADAACSVPSFARAKIKITADLKEHPYSARFIDTITASPWRECYNPAHPTDRRRDRSAKMALLQFVSNDEHLVTGCETGIDPAVPYADYFEGMMSLARYRLPNSGYNIGKYQTPTADLMKYQIGTGYRAPLFELVYHDCIVSTWYWGDASNTEPEVWDQRDLYNILYGTEPVFILDSSRWREQKARLLQSYNEVCKTVRTVGYTQMVSHAFLTSDHDVQQTKWSNGTTITVNFGKIDYRKADGVTVNAMRYLVQR